MTDATQSEGLHTPGPWAWFGNARNNDIYLATVNRGRRYVMGFRRWGMGGAQPSFQPEGRGLVPASDLLIFEVGNRDVRGVEAAKADDSVYRLDISGIDCADARLIEASPDLLAACKLAIPSGVCLTNKNVPDDFTVSLDCTMGDLRKIAAAIARAEGKSA